MNDHRVTKADLPTIKDSILAYRRWREMYGKQPDTFWAAKVRAALEKDGIVKPKGAQP